MLQGDKIPIKMRYEFLREVYVSHRNLIFVKGFIDIPLVDMFSCSQAENGCERSKTIVPITFSTVTIKLFLREDNFGRVFY